jgi:Domain of Unknown Function (DUF748)
VRNPGTVPLIQDMGHSPIEFWRGDAMQMSILKINAARVRERVAQWRNSRRVRKSILIAGSAILLYALFGFFAVPALLQHWIDTRAATLIGRPVSVGALRFNPFTLKLGVDQVHIGDADGAKAFIDVDTLTVNASWTSLFHWAPVLDALELQRPRIVLSRDAEQRFNFADLIERFKGEPARPDAEPARFSLSNIAVHGGDIRFDDATLKANHHLENIELGIPFLANLPHETDVFVQPLLAMNVDGSPLRIQGQTKPFASSLESTIDFHLDHLDIPRYLSYVPAELPVAIARGQLSGDLQLRFVDLKPAPQLNVVGNVMLDDFLMNDKGGAAIAQVAHASAVLADVQPLLARYRFGKVQLDRATLHYSAMAGGHSNFDALLGTGQPAAAKIAKSPATEVALTELALLGSRFDYTNRTGATPATLGIDALKGSLSGLNTLSGSAAVDISGEINNGAVASRGKLDLNGSRYDGSLNLQNVDIVPLQALLAPAFAATLRQGRIDAHGNLVGDWHAAVNLQLETLTADLHDIAIGLRDGKDNLVTWSASAIAITHFDLLKREAQLGDVLVHGLVLNAQRNAEGKLDLLALSAMSKAAPAAANAKPTPGDENANAAVGWHWRLARFAIDNAALNLRDAAAHRPTEVQLKDLNGEVAGLSEQFAQPLKVALAGNLGKGNFDLNGTARPEPLSAELKLKTRELNIAEFAPYVEVPLNVSVTQAQLTSTGDLHYSTGNPAKLSYRGHTTFGRVRVQDKISGDDFLRWSALDIGSVDFAQGDGPLRIALGAMTLSDFYARVIMNANGRLNLADVSGKGATEPVSVTRVEDVPANAAPAPASPATVAVNLPPAPAAQIQIGQTTLARGQLNYTDNFIKPNYTANITQLTGRIGAFGSNGGTPATVSLQGQLDDTAQVNIDGTIDPLAASMFLDIKGKAVGVELTHLSAYSSRYTGYPIEKGRLNADVSYLLQTGKLKADNHLFIDQLTFGEHVDTPGASNLPVKLAVALLKNSHGEIDVNVPVSGSLDDPQFSVGGMLWRALGGLIAKAATSPFRLLAAAFNHGGGSGAEAELGYVEYPPGADALDDTAKAKLEQIAKILIDRPSLNLGIIGRTDPAFDAAGLRQVQVDELIGQEYANDNGGNADALPAVLSAEDHERYLKAAYKHATFAKPKNLIGLTEAQPAEEMRKMLEANIAVDESAMLHLAERRAGHVVGFLHGKVEDRRLFVLAPKLDPKGIDDQGKTTRVDFGLQ